MWLHFLAISPVLIASQTLSPALSNNQLNLHISTSKKNTSIDILLDLKDKTPPKCQIRQSGGLVIKEDYHYSPGVGCHKLHTDKKLWDEARIICNEEGGHLAIIDSVAEGAVLHGMLNESKQMIIDSEAQAGVFLGIHDIYKEDDWVTLLGDPLNSTIEYNQFSPTWGTRPQPDGGTDQNCGALLLEGRLNDLWCYRTFPFFCEISPVRNPLSS